MVGGGGVEKNSSSKRSDPQRPKRPSHHRQNNSVKEVGTPSVRSNLWTSLTAVSTAARSKVTKAVSEKQLLKPEAKDSPTP